MFVQTSISPLLKAYQMVYPGYWLNPGDMFQVEPSSVMFATGAPKTRGSTGRKTAKSRSRRARRSPASKRQSSLCLSRRRRRRSTPSLHTPRTYPSRAKKAPPRTHDPSRRSPRRTHQTKRKRQAEIPRLAPIHQAGHRSLEIRKTQKQSQH